MEENFLSKKEEQKSIPSIYVDTNNKNNLHTTNNTLYKTRQTYSKRINTNNMKKLKKIFSRDRILLEVANDPGYKNLKTLNKKNNDNINENITEKEKIINHILISEKEIDKINNELKQYQDFYNQLQETNLTFKAIIEKILSKQNQEKYDDNITDIISYDKEYMLNAFKRQIEDYEKDIEKQNKILAETKNEKKINNFLEINKLLDEKNQELENLISKNKKLQISKKKKEEVINYYYHNIQDIKVNSIKIKDNIKLNEKNKENIEKQIDDLESEKEQIFKKLNTLVEESINVELESTRKKEELNSLTNKYNKYEKILKQKEKNETLMDNILNKINNIKKAIEKNSLKINRLNYDNDEMENDIYILQAESDKLNEKIKPKQKIKNDTKINEKEKFFITEEIKNNENADKIKEENKEINKDLKNIDNNNINKENDNNSNELLNEIEELKKTLEKKKNENNNIVHELEEIKTQYNDMINKK